MDLTDMTQARWDRMSPAEKTKARDNSDLIPELIGLEGWKIEAAYPDGTKRRFILGKSTGWRPCHLEIATQRSSGGSPVYWPKGTTFTKIRRMDR